MNATKSTRNDSSVNSDFTSILLDERIDFVMLSIKLVFLELLGMYTTTSNPNPFAL